MKSLIPVWMMNRGRDLQGEDPTVTAGWLSVNVASLALVLFTAFSTSLLAQQQTAQLTGRVDDSSGAAIPGATITVSDPSKGFKVTTKSEANGDYFVPLLLPADDYQIHVDMTGF